MTSAAALEYAERGLRVLPIWGVRDGRCDCGDETCGSAGKHPVGRLVPHGCNNATTDTDVIRGWYGDEPGANLAVATGARSGVFVLDIDGPEGVASLAELEEAHGVLPVTVAQTTGRGRHLFFRHPGPDQRVGNSSGELNPGLDVRGDGGYVVVAPSVHASGVRYAWAEGSGPDEREFADAPSWLIDLVTAPRVRHRANVVPIDGRRSAAGRNEDVLQNQERLVRNAPEGTRNNNLNLAAYTMGRLVTAGGFAERAVNDGLTSAALAVGLTPQETARTIQSGLEAGMSRPQLEIGSDVEIARRLAADLSRMHGEVVWCEGQFWRHDVRCWVPIVDQDLRLAVHEFDGTNIGERGRVKLSRTRINSVLEILKDILGQPDFFSSAVPGINCASGSIRFDEEGGPSIEAHDPAHRARHTLPGRWPLEDWNQYQGSLLETLLTGCFRGDPDYQDKIDLIGDIAGSAALGYGTGVRSPRAVVFYGPAAENGKSQVLDVLRGLVPPGAVSSISPASFGDRTFLVRLVGKLLNATDELGGADAIASEKFKQVVTGDPVTARDVHRSATQFRPVAQHVFAANVLPTFRGGMDPGVRRRLLVVTFNQVIPEADRISHIGQRVAAEEPDLLLDFAVRGASRLIARGQFTAPSSSDVALREWFLNADPVLAWLDSDAVSTGQGLDHVVRTADAHSAFRSWSVANGYDANALPRIAQFTQRVRAVVLPDPYRRGAGPIFRGMVVGPRGQGSW